MPGWAGWRTAAVRGGRTASREDVELHDGSDDRGRGVACRQHLALAWANCSSPCLYLSRLHSHKLSVVAIHYHCGCVLHQRFSSIAQRLPGVPHAAVCRSNTLMHGHVTLHGMHGIAGRSIGQARRCLLTRNCPTYTYFLRITLLSLSTAIFSINYSKMMLRLYSESVYTLYTRNRRAQPEKKKKK